MYLKFDQSFSTIESLSFSIFFKCSRSFYRRFE